MHLAKSEISKRGFVMIVEGQMDTISLHQAGYSNTVAISGTALTDEQIKMLKRLTKRIYLCLDNDNAGITATFVSIENLRNEDLDVRVISFGDYKDPDEFLKSGGNFQDLIDNAQSLIHFYIAQGAKKHDLNTMPGKKALVTDLMNILKIVNSRIEVDMYLQEISSHLGIDKQTLYEEYRSFRVARKPKAEEAPKVEGFDVYEQMIGYLLSYDFFDLFFEKFEYNLDNIPNTLSAQALRLLLADKE
jgi:DNA primase